MLSTKYRLRLEATCKKIMEGQNVELSEMIWCEKLSRVNSSAATMLRQARRKAQNPEMQEGDLDDFLNQLDLGDPDQSNHRTGFADPNEIRDWFHRNDTDSDEWRRRD